MFGFSIFLNQELTIETKSYIKKMAAAGFSGIFTSLHIPEDDPTLYRTRLAQLGQCAKESKLELMADISGDALQKAGFSFTDLTELKEMGLTGLRMDYHISNEQIAQLTHDLTIALNASTLTETDIKELRHFKADFAKLEAWHNYYPRPETGLDRNWYEAKNTWLKEQGFNVQGFVAGDENLRGPLFKGLPTLEEHRNLTPFAQALALKATTDRVYIGDGGLSPESRNQFSEYINHDVICLRVLAQDATLATVLGEHQNRLDEARDVIRSADARFKPISQIVPLAKTKRLLGSVTIDNEKYLRYMGEIQITKCDLAADEKVNVLGRVIAKDRPLLAQIKAGTKFKLESVEK